jgi:drug/metabolite transporter (DMT)-like permease
MLNKLKFPPVLILILLSLIWGTSFILIKQGLKIFAPDEVGALRVTAASLFLMPIAFSTEGTTSGPLLQIICSGIDGHFFSCFSFCLGANAVE